MSATANYPLARLRFWDTTVGKKAVMAVTGFILFGFVVGHLAGNLQIYEPPEKLNHYSEMLRSVPSLLGGARVTLLSSVCLHLGAAFALRRLERPALPFPYPSTWHRL